MMYFVKFVSVDPDQSVFLYMGYVTGNFKQWQGKYSVAPKQLVLFDEDFLWVILKWETRVMRHMGEGIIT